MIAWVISEFNSLISRLESIDMSNILGFSMSFWQLLVTLFVCGTIVTLITGSDDD